MSHRSFYVFLLSLFALSFFLHSSCAKKFTAADLSSEANDDIVVLQEKPKNCDARKKVTTYVMYNYNKSEVSIEKVAIAMLKKKAKKKDAKAVRLKEIVRSKLDGAAQLGHNTTIKGFIYDCTK